MLQCLRCQQLLCLWFISVEKIHNDLIIIHNCKKLYFWDDLSLPIYFMRIDGSSFWVAQKWFQVLLMSKRIWLLTFHPSYLSHSPVLPQPQYTTSSNFAGPLSSKTYVFTTFHMSIYIFTNLDLEVTSNVHQVMCVSSYIWLYFL